jgi:hypothetical protein
MAQAARNRLDVDAGAEQKAHVAMAKRVQLAELPAAPRRQGHRVDWAAVFVRYDGVISV